MTVLPTLIHQLPLMYSRFQMDLVGPFRLLAPNGVRVVVKAKRSRILLAMLATSRSGERSRQWLQNLLWGSRDRLSSQASMRRELSNLKAQLAAIDDRLLVVDRETVGLDLLRVDVDIHDMDKILSTRDDFLEGIDLAGEEGFEDWLRQERQSISALRGAVGSSRTPDMHRRSE